MPIYDYRCTDCNSTYDVYFKGREEKSIVVCPKCSSMKHVKLVSVPSVSMGESSSAGPDSCDSGGGGCCGGGMCGMN